MWGLWLYFASALALKPLLVSKWLWQKGFTCMI